MKKVILAAAVLAGWSSGYGHAKTRVFVQNNTPTTFTVAAVQTGHSLGGDKWGRPRNTIAPGERAEIVWFNRDSGIKDGKDFYFTETLTGGGARLVLKQRLRGKLVNSHMWQSLEDQPWHDDRRTYSLAWKAGGQKVQVDYRAFETGTEDNIEYILKGSYVTPPATRAEEINVLTYNIYMRPTKLFVNGQSERAGLLPAALKGYDVIIFSEAFDNDVRAKLLRGLHPDYPHHTRILDKSSTFKAGGNGGVVIVSKWPIEAQDQEGYNDVCSGTDSHVAKGVLYAAINKSGRRYHVFGTHTQADPTAKEAAVRVRQFGILKRFLDAKRIPAKEAVIIGGDLNVDKIKYPKQYEEMLKILNAAHPTPRGHPSTFDPKVNKVADKGATEFLDYVLYSRAHLQPKTSYNEVRMIRADREWKSFPTDKAKWDLSDHFAVFGRFVFP
jgi:sphingomyelin phosphodiesterase